MKKILKQVLGIDVAKDELVESLGRKLDNLDDELYCFDAFPNTKKGINDLEKWALQNTAAELPIHFIMEATGVYHEKLAYFLDEQGYKVSIVMPTKIAYYRRTLESKTKTDIACSRVIAQFGLSIQVAQWHRPNAVYKSLRQLTRERDQLVEQCTMTKNMLHAEKSEAEPSSEAMARMLERIALLTKQKKAVEKEIKAGTKNDPEANEKMKLITSIPGFATTSASIILAETNGFELVVNRRQLASYAGFDVSKKESGSSIKGKPKMSKKGNKFLRKAIHLPSLSGKKCMPEMTEVYKRIVDKTGIKMKGLAAVQRRMLELAYTLCENKTMYVKDYKQKKEQEVSGNNKIRIAK